MTEFTDIRQGHTMTMEPYNRDDRGLAIMPGHRMRICVANGHSIVMDREQLVRALAFLEAAE